VASAAPQPTHPALNNVTNMSFWLDNPARPEPLPALAADITCDLLVIGGGFTGLWTALLAKQADPQRDVVVLEGGSVGWAASGRNGGFVSASLTHGFRNGLDRFPDELEALIRLGQENLEAIEQTIAEFAIDCDWQRSGELDVAVKPWQVNGLKETAELMRERGLNVEFLDREQVRAHLDSPTYLAGLLEPDAVAIVDPARLVWGLRDACLSLGVRIFEQTPATALRATATGMQATTAAGVIRASRVALASNIFPPLLQRISHYVVPVYDYVLMTEPLTDEQLTSIGWNGREGVGDAGNQFHYYRLSADNRILWGGYDAVYYFGGKVHVRYDERAETFDALAHQFFDAFPQLEGLKFTHAWGGAIDTCSRFTAFWGTAFKDKVAYVAGYTGLGVGATRFGAQVMLDLLDGIDNERTRLKMVQTKPVPFPPEPVRFAGIELTRRSIALADRREGKRNLWLRTLDKAGLGFDS
jgi:glycine/D-amino acid oxidase-like deaminating enzyme